MSTAERKLELDLMRGYEQSFKLRMTKVISLSYQCLPLNKEQHSTKVSQLSQCMKLIDPNQKDLSQHDELILGKIQGQSASTNFRQVIQSIVGEISQAKFKAYLKQKTQQKNYGVSNKDKNCSLRQVKKIQSLKKYYDFNQINKKRKYNRLYSIATKSLAKYLDFYSKINEADPETINQAFQQYTIYSKEEKKFNNFIKQQQEIQPQNVIDKPLIIEEPIIVEKTEAIIEQEHKIQEEIKEQPKKVEEQKKQPQQKQNKTPKKTKPKSKKNQTKAEDVDGIVTEKEKSDSDQKKKKEQKEKALKKQEIQRTAKKTTNRSLTEFFVIKKKQTPEIQKKLTIQQEQNLLNQEGQKVEQKDEPEPQTAQQSVWSTFGQQAQTPRIPINDLRSQFRSLKMQNQQYNPQPYYTNIIITLSTLQYFDHLMTVQRQVNFSSPFQRIDQVFYFQDQSEQFQGQNADEQAQQDEQADESQLSVGNNTILDDDHLSNEELSSCEPYEIDLKVEYGKQKKWVFGHNCKAIMQSEDQLEIINNFSMICLESQQKMPLRLQEQEETVQILMTPELWRDVYKIAHGYHGTKEAIIKDITVILPGVSKTWIDSMLKERSQKVLNQRFIKKDFIDDIKQKISQIDTILDNVLSERNQQLRKIKAEKNQQKDQKLQKDILECTGSRYIVNLLKQLKEKGYKTIRRNQLIEFINERKGEQWESIKVEMNSMSRPIAQMIRNMPAVDRIDQEVVVQDQEYNKDQGEEKLPGQSSASNASTKQKIDALQLKQTKSGKKMCKLEKGEKSAKQRKRKNKESKDALTSIYEKKKPISRARKTKNSMKTGILSMQELKKQKEQRLKQGEQPEQQEENGGDEEVKENMQENQENIVEQSADEDNQEDNEQAPRDSQQAEQEECMQNSKQQQNSKSQKSAQLNSEQQLRIVQQAYEQNPQLQKSLPASQDNAIDVEKPQIQVEHQIQNHSMSATNQPKTQSITEHQGVTLNNIQLQ